MSDLSQFRDAIAAATETLGSLSSLEAPMAEAADLIEQCLRAGNKLLICGNGGSAADASHFATELVVRFAKDRPAYPAICLASDGGLLTAAGNDYGFDEIFAQAGRGIGSPGRRPHLPDHFGQIEKCIARSRGSESARAENDRLSRPRRRINHWHCRCRSFGSRATQLRAFRKRTSFCSTCSARPSSRGSRSCSRFAVRSAALMA